MRTNRERRSVQMGSGSTVAQSLVKCYLGAVTIGWTFCRRHWLVAWLGLSACVPPAKDLTLDLAFVADAGVGDPVDAGPAEAPSSVTSTGCWSMPRVLGPGYGGDHVLAPMPSGEALVAWRSSKPAELWSKRLLLDGGATAPERLQPLPGGPRAATDLWSLRLVANAAGQAVLGWIQASGPGPTREVMLSRFRPDAGWGPEERVATDAHLDIAWLEVGLDGRGDLVVVWPRQTDFGTDVLARRWALDAGWFPEERVTPPQTALGDVALRVSEDGLGVVAWRGWYPPDSVERVHATTWLYGRRDAVVLDAVDADGYGISLAAQGTGALVTWTRRNDQSEVRAARFASGTWQAAEVVLASDAGAVEPWSLSTFDASGRPAVWWNLYGQSSVNWDIVTSTAWWSPAGWSAPVSVARSDTNPPHFVTQASNGLGQEVVAWSRPPSLLVRRSDADAGALDHIEGLFDWPLSLAIGPSGARWLMGQESADPWRAVALVCP